MERDQLESFAAEQGLALFRYAFLLTGSRADAEDLVQRAYVRLLEVPTRRPLAPAAYTRRIIFNQYCSASQSKSHPVAVIDSTVAAFEDALVLRSWMWSELGQLSTRQRAVLVLRYYEELSDEEIAGIVGCRRATVRSLAARALKRLHDRYQSSAATSAESKR